MAGRYNKRGYKKQQSAGHIGDVLSDTLHDIPGKKKNKAEMELFYQWHKIAAAADAASLTPIKLIHQGRNTILRMRVHEGDALLWEYKKEALLEIIHQHIGARVIDDIRFVQI